MRAKVTQEGIIIPKRLLEGVDEVEIRQERNVILIVPVGKADPILTLGTEPISLEMEDASLNHDHYLYHS